MLWYSATAERLDRKVMKFISFLNPNFDCNNNSDKELFKNFKFMSPIPAGNAPLDLSWVNMNSCMVHRLAADNSEN